eukprot:230663-Pyramimonas_sp.AAC.1
MRAMMAARRPRSRWRPRMAKRGSSTCSSPRARGRAGAAAPLSAPWVQRRRRGVATPSPAAHCATPGPTG